MSFYVNGNPQKFHAMSSFRVRPRFKHYSNHSARILYQSIQSCMDEKPQVAITNKVDGHLTLKIPLEERHYWSPELNLTFEENEKGTIIRGLYGPNPSVWAVFFFGYVALGLLFLGIGMWGFVQWNLGISSKILWLLPGLAVLAFLLYIVAQLGQKIGAEQMYRLHHFYETSIGSNVSIN